MIPAIHEGLLVELASTRTRQPYDGPTPEQVDVVGVLHSLRRAVDDLCQNVMMRGDGPWLSVADQLNQAAERCRNIDRFTAEQRLLQQSVARCPRGWRCPRCGQDKAICADCA
ncbi:hypothetical protein [Actinophytocola sp. NPDC049390]|uniref:hypothetical protein n=1 Tax=Actinophytocola sp. NPDC049390 TaxID=3363894 RepID=UPI0037B6F005